MKLGKGILNEDSGFQGLQDFLQKHNVEEVKACMEATSC